MRKGKIYFQLRARYLFHIARLVLFCRISTFCISDINCVEVLTSRVSQETYGNGKSFLFLMLMRCVVIIPWEV